MKNFFVFGALFIATFANADWAPMVGLRGKTMDIYTSVAVRGEATELQILDNYHGNRGTDLNPIRSRIQFVEINCKRGTYQVKRVNLYSGEMGRGSLHSTQEQTRPAAPPASKSFEEVFLQRVCESSGQSIIVQGTSPGDATRIAADCMAIQNVYRQGVRAVTVIEFLPARRAAQIGGWLERLTAGTVHPTKVYFTTLDGKRMYQNFIVYRDAFNELKCSATP